MLATQGTADTLLQVGQHRKFWILMRADQEKFVKVVFQALGEWWTSLGAVAWLLVGVVLVVGILALIVLLRWVLRGGLSRHKALGFSGRRSEVDQSSRSDS